MSCKVILIAGLAAALLLCGATILVDAGDSNQASILLVGDMMRESTRRSIRARLIDDANRSFTFTSNIANALNLTVHGQVLNEINGVRGHAWYCAITGGHVFPVKKSDFAPISSSIAILFLGGGLNAEFRMSILQWMENHNSAQYVMKINSTEFAINREGILIHPNPTNRSGPWLRDPIIESIVELQYKKADRDREVEVQSMSKRWRTKTRGEMEEVKTRPKAARFRKGKKSTNTSPKKSTSTKQLGLKKK